MPRRSPTYYTESQRALMWERWQRGESLQTIAQLFDRNHSWDRALHASIQETSHFFHYGRTPDLRCEASSSRSAAQFVAARHRG
jgi:hypothetical protein